MYVFIHCLYLLLDRSSGNTAVFKVNLYMSAFHSFLKDSFPVCRIYGNHNCIFCYSEHIQNIIYLLCYGFCSEFSSDSDTRSLYMMIHFYLMLSSFLSLTNLNFSIMFSSAHLGLGVGGSHPFFGNVLFIVFYYLGFGKPNLVSIHNLTISVDFLCKVPPIKK